MTTANTAGRGLAIAAGVVLATGTLAILFEDVLVHGAAFTLKHWLTLVTVAGTMMVGHLADLARRHGHWMSVAGFSLLFLAGTGLVVYSSVGRQAEKTLTAGAEHDDIVSKRRDLTDRLTAERELLRSKQEAASLECRSGDGPRCRGARAMASVYADNVAGLEARIEKMKPPTTVAPEAEQFATVAAALGYDKEHVKALAVLLAPFFTTLFLEFGTIVSFGFAFSPKRQPKQLLLPKPVVTIEATVADSSEPKRSNSGPPNDPKRRLTRDEVLTDLMVRNATRRGFDSQEEAAKHYSVSSSRYSEWLRDWEAEGKIPNRRMVGRCKMIEV